MGIIRIFTLATLMVFTSCYVHSQSPLTQTVRGTIVDANSKSPLIGAAITVEGSEPLMGTATNADGIFRLERVPVGRHNFKVSYFGYEPFIVSEILVGSGKEVVLSIELQGTTLELEGVVVTANTNKDRPLNTMATLSARTFSVEETNRYAGGLDDPARLASAFAGVTTTQTTNNAIIIRGNSPRGVLWRFEGVDIPAAFHFPNVDFIGGGGFTVLSNQMLQNSDFYTGAFPAEYGNASSGVFDIKMRTGNAERREYTAGISLIGMDLSAEGPIVAEKSSTYLFNYRYSTLGLIGTLTNFPNIPKFQDVSYMLNFPTENAGTFSFWGLGAHDINTKTAESDTLKWETDYDRTGQDYYNRFGAIGLSHRITIGTNTFIHSTLSADGMRYGMDKEEYTFDRRLLPTDNIRSTEGKFSARSTIFHRHSSRVSSLTGITLNRLFFDNHMQLAFRDNPEEMTTFVYNSGTGFSTQSFTQVRFSLLPNLSTNVGFHSMYLDVNDKMTFEPRAGIRWNVSPNDELSFAYGLHAQMEELRTYYSQTTRNGTIETPNKHLDFMKSHHFVLGYNRKVSDVMRVIIEPYYQILQDIPVYPNHSFSIINLTSNWAINQPLESRGTGTNYGIDVTAERFLKDGYFYLVTASIFDSKYVGGDGIEYNTRFNRGHVANLLVGKEWMVRGQNILSFSTKLTYMGGLRYTPALYDESIEAQMYIPDNSKAFASQFPASTGVDFTINYRINKTNRSGVWSLMVKNALLQPDYSDPFYDFMTKEVIVDKMRLPIPSLGYKIEF
ncbi:carboxypeptidase-like regulatory domain-containing protein [Rhodohalobacter sp. SW132]|nr:carboxypeptidase-like regulatory domain-containing protein [Rhodohalobacter sp. SW132]